MGKARCCPPILTLLCRPSLALLECLKLLPPYVPVPDTGGVAQAQLPLQKLPARIH